MTEKLYWFSKNDKQIYYSNCKISTSNNVKHVEPFPGMYVQMWSKSLDEIVEMAEEWLCEEVEYEIKRHANTIENLTYVRMTLQKFRDLDPEKN